jgi:Flp pilus assembly protein TadG
MRPTYRTSTALGLKLASFSRARHGIAAVEFAIVMPVLLMFLLGGTEIARYINMGGAMTRLAYAEADLVAERPSGSAALSTNDIIFGEEATPLIFPEILRDAARQGLAGGNQAWMNDIQFTISSVTFTPTVAGCTSNCTYTAAVTWSSAQNASKRSCTIAPTQASDTAEPSLTTLPADVYTSGTLIVVDLAYQYVPVFGGAFVPPIWIRRSAYLQPRYNNAITYSGIPSC